MKKRKANKPRYRRTPMFICYMTGTLDRWFHRNNGSVENSAFLAQRASAYMSCVSSAMNSLVSMTLTPRSDAKKILASIQPCPAGCGTAQIRAEKQLARKAEELITLDDAIITARLRAKEAILPYRETLKAQLLAYSHGLRAPVSEAEAGEFFSVEHNAAYIAYRQDNAEDDAVIHDYAKKIYNIGKEDTQ